MDMTQTPEDRWTGANPDEEPGGDRTRKVIHALLALYLLPAVLIVLAVGAVLAVLVGALKVVAVIGRAVAPGRSAPLNYDSAPATLATISAPVRRMRGGAPQPGRLLSRTQVIGRVDRVDHDHQS